MIRYVTIKALKTVQVQKISNHIKLYAIIGPQCADFTVHRISKKRKSDPKKGLGNASIKSGLAVYIFKRTFLQGV